MHAHPPDNSTVILDASFGSLDEFDAETAPGQRILDVTPAGIPITRPPKSLSRVESMQARHRSTQLKRVAAAGRVVGTASLQLSAAMRRLSSRVHGRLVKKALSARKVDSPAKVTVHDPESDGVIIASLLSIVAITYGSFLTAAWRHPVELQAASAPPVTVVAASAVMAAAPRVDPVVAPIVHVVQSVPPAAAPVVSEPVVAHPGADGVSARTLTAMWKQRDTRSLDHAFADLRRETLAFHRCGMRKTGDDRAIANCEGAGATWTIDFQRSAGRWQIGNVATR